MAIKAGLGGTPIEKRTIDAHLERLEVDYDPATREIRSAGDVVGGMESLRKAADASGELSLSALAQLEQGRGTLDTVKNHVARIRGRDDEAVAQATLKGAQASLQAAGAALATLDRSTATDETFAPLDRVARRINHAAQSVAEALRKGSLSFASDADLGEIRDAWAGFLDGVGVHLHSMKNVDIFFRGVGGVVVEDHNARSLGRLRTGALALEFVQGAERLDRAYASIAWLTDNFNLFDLRSIDGLKEADTGTYQQRLIGLAQLGHGLIQDHPRHAQFARQAYDLISNFAFPNASSESSLSKKEAFGRAVDTAHFTLHRMFESDRYVEPKLQRAQLLAHLKDQVDFGFTFHQGNVALDASRLDYLMYAQRAECVGEPVIAQRIEQMSDALWSVEASPRTGNRAEVRAASKMFTSSMQSFVDSEPVFRDVPESFVPQHAAAAATLREALEDNRTWDSRNRDLRENHIDAWVLGAITFLSLDRPSAAAELKKRYTGIAALPAEQFIASARELTEQIIQVLQSYRADDGLRVSNRRSDGVHYAIARRDDGRNVLDVRVKIERDGDTIAFPEIAGRPTIAAEKLPSLVYHATTDGWKTLEDIKPKLVSKHWIQYELPLAGVAGDAKVEGLFHHAGVEWIKNHGGNFSGYQIDLVESERAAAFATSIPN